MLGSDNFSIKKIMNLLFIKSHGDRGAEIADNFPSSLYRIKRLYENLEGRVQECRKPYPIGVSQEDWKIFN